MEHEKEEMVGCLVGYWSQTEPIRWFQTKSRCKKKKDEKWNFWSWSKAAERNLFVYILRGDHKKQS